MRRIVEELPEEAVSVPSGKVWLEGNLVIPFDARAVLLFAHGSGSSRHSIRNRFVAGMLREGGMATLLFDLLSPDEEAIDLETTHLRFDIALLAERLMHAIDWVQHHEPTKNLKMGLFGSSTGAAAALVASAHRPDQIGAVVSRGGRPDMAGSALAQVVAPTLLIVGGADGPVITLNQQAFERLSCKKRLEIIPRATHLFEEPGALEEVARLARDWFMEKLNVGG